MDRPQLLGDGTMFLPGPDFSAAPQLDQEFWRSRDPRERRWATVPRRGTRTILDLGRAANRARVTLVGKGPSVDRWRPGIETIFCINEAGLLFPNRASFALDDRPIHHLAGVGKMVVTAADCLARAQLDRSLAFVFGWNEAAELRLEPGWETAPCALAILGYLGYRSITMVGFDAYDWIDQEIAPAPNYARQILDMGVPDRISGEWAPINRHLREAASRWALRLRWWHRGTAQNAIEFFNPPPGKPGDD